MLKHSEEPLARHDNRPSTASERTTGSWTILLLVLFFASGRGFLGLDRAWRTSLAKFLLTGIILAAAFWLIARFSGSAFASMHFHDELRLVLLVVGGTIVHALAISSCSAAAGLSRSSAARQAGARPQGATDIGTSLDFARSACYTRCMIKCSRTVNRNHMTRFGWAVEGVVR